MARGKISAANTIKKKSVYCVDNVDPSCTVDDLRSFVRSMGINVVSCFAVKPR